MSTNFRVSPPPIGSTTPPPDQPTKRRSSCPPAVAQKTQEAYKKAIEAVKQKKVLPPIELSESDKRNIIIIDAIVDLLIKEKLWEYPDAFRTAGNYTWVLEQQQKIGRAKSKEEIISIVSSLKEDKNPSLGNNLISLLKKTCSEVNCNIEHILFPQTRISDLVGLINKSSVCLLKRDELQRAFPPAMQSKRVW